jgi:hypothetical protein
MEEPGRFHEATLVRIRQLVRSGGAALPVAHPTRDRSLRDIKAEHEKLAMDAWRSPRGVLNDHSEDQFLNLLRRRSSPDGPPDLGDQLPVQPESGPVPTDDRFGRDHDEGLLPSEPESTDGDPEELVE